MACLIGIDIGSTNCKAVASAADSTVKSSACRPMNTDYVENNGPNLIRVKIGLLIKSVKRSP